MLTELLRQMSYALAFIVGALSAQASPAAVTSRLPLRSTAWATLGAALLCILYWAFTNGVLPQLPLVSSLLSDVRDQSVYLGRSIFPFTEDSPNLGAFVFVALGAFTGPALVLQGAKRDRWLGYFTVLTCMAAVLTTQSRTGLVAAGAAGLTVLALLPAAHGRRRRAIFGAAVLIIGVAAVYQSFPSNRNFSQGSATVQNREQVWRQAVGKIEESPVIGQGYHFSVRDPFVQDVADPALGAATVRRNSVHSDYLGALVDGGMVALVVLVTLLAAAGVAAFQLRFRTAGRGTPAGVGLAGMLAGLTVAMAFNAMLESAAVAIVVWLCCGIAGGTLLRVSGEAVPPETESA
jgi:O-antigen ligase